MECPICKKDLNDYLLKDVVYQRCGNCGGFWFDKDKLGQIKKQKDWFKVDTILKEAKLKVIHGELKCPRCSETLHILEYSHETGIKVNLCSKCEGLWLDSGELQAIHEASESWMEKIKEKAEEDLIAVELFLIKIGPYLPK